MDNAPSTASQLRRIDEICGEFEAALLRGDSSRTEEFVVGSEDPIHMPLLLELVQLEIHYHDKRSVDEWLRRFPQLARDWLHEVLQVAGDPSLPAIPGYRLVREIGRGGMGIVWLATDLTLRRQVAIKMILDGRQHDVDMRQRFLREARAAARLHHPNLVQIHETGEDNDLPYLVFEYIDGGTLSDWARGGRSHRDLAAMMETLARAVQFAHEHHIIHRDLKPTNILIDRRGVPHITDFGLAKQLDDDLTHTLSGMLIGTPAYMAPEQVLGGPTDAGPSIDVYSLGAILYELLTGRPPFQGASLAEIFEQLKDKSPVRPREISALVPRDLETICLKCLEKNPQQRYLSALVLADDLSRFLRGDSIVARRVSTSERAARWCRRHPLPASLTAALLFVIVAGFIAVTRQWQIAVEQRSIAESKTLAANEQRELAEDARQAAERRFAMAQQPVQELIRLGQELVRRPGLEKRGKEAIGKATEFRRSLLNEKIDDPETRLATASTLRVLGWTLLEHGQLVDAEETSLQAFELLSGLHEEAPADRAVLRELRSVCLYRGTALFQLRRYDQAEECHAAGVGFARKVVAALPKSVSDRDRLANSLTNYSAALFQLNRREEALQTMQEAVAIHREVSDERPDVRTFQANLALALTNLSLHIRDEDKSRSEALALEAVAIRRRHLEESKSPRQEAHYFLASVIPLADAYVGDGRIAEAEALLDEATGHGRKAAEAYPEYFATRSYLIRALQISRLAARRREDSRRESELLAELRAELDAVVRTFPQEQLMRQSAAYYDHVRGAELAEQGRTAEGMALMTESLNRMISFQQAADDPAELSDEISAIAQSILKVGSPAEFESGKLLALNAKLQQSPDDPVLLSELAWRLMFADDDSLRDPAAAEAAIRRAIQAQPDESAHRSAVAWALLLQDRIDEAAACLDGAGSDEETPAPLAALYGLSQIKAIRGDPDGAHALFVTAEERRAAEAADDPWLNKLSDSVRQTVMAQPDVVMPP